MRVAVFPAVEFGAGRVEDVDADAGGVCEGSGLGGGQRGSEGGGGGADFILRQHATQGLAAVYAIVEHSTGAEWDDHTAICPCWTL